MLRAEELILNGLLAYQPFVITDDLETGVGLEFADQRYVGIVYYPGLDRRRLEQSPQLRRIVVDQGLYPRFHKANSELRRLYDHLIDRICAALGGVDELSVLDVGCNAGYFPIAFCQRGVKQAAGCDREAGFARTLDFLNEVVGTRAQFINTSYNPQMRRIADCPVFDLVISVTVMNHISEPLFFLEALAGITGRALFVYGQINNDTDRSIHFGDPRGDYHGANFPYCYDNGVAISEPLLRESLKLLLGFAQVTEIVSKPDMISLTWGGHKLRGFLALR